MESIDRLRKYVGANTDKTVALTTYPEQYGVHCTTVINDLIDAIEREVEERYIEGPTDKYGEPVRVGDVLQGERLYDGWCEPFKVHRLRIESDGWHACEKCGKGHIVRRCRHKPPTVEDVLREFALEIDPSADVDVSGAKTITEFAKRLQLREEEE